jgi:hypothetical protein
MRKKILFLILALVAFAGAGVGLFSPSPAEAACWTYCCPDAPSVCVTCCKPGWCDLNCPAP